MRPLNRESRELIAEASATDTPAPELQDEIWRRLSARFSEPLPASAAAAEQALSGRARSGWRALSKLTLGTSAAGFLCAAGLVLYASVGAVPARGPARSDPSVAPQPARVQNSAALAVEAPEVDAAREATGAGQAMPAKVTAPAPARSTLSAETRLIAAGQRALNGAQAERALRFIAQHKQRFPRGVLVEEREALRVLALCALPEPAPARAAWRRFQRDWSNSALAERVRAGCPAALRE